MSRTTAAAALFLFACGTPPGAVDGGDDAAVDASLEDSSADVDASTPVCARYAFERATGDLSSFPNIDAYEPAETFTGFQVRVGGGRFPGVESYLSYQSVWESLDELDGFGTSAGAFLGFEGAFVDPPIGGPESDPATIGFGFVVVPDEGPSYLVPAELTAVDDEQTLLLSPTLPLPEATWVGAYVQNTLAPCTEPSDFMVGLLETEDPNHRAVLTALAEAGIPSDSLLALQPYPTQSITPVARTIAGEIAASPAEDFALAFDRCRIRPSIGARHCTSTLTASDYRDADGAIRDAEPTAEWSLTVHAWLPMTSTGTPMATLMFGHGISVGAQENTPSFVSDALRNDIILVSVSAMVHEDHPTAATPPGTMIDTTLAFFAADAEADTVDAPRLRENLRQTVFDRLHLARALSLAPDLDGDSEPDVDPTRLGYLGVSLGAILGAQTMALTDVFSLGILSEPGGQLRRVMTDGGFELILASLIPREFRGGTVERLFVAVQTALDRGDPVNWARHLQRDRLFGDATDIFVQMAVDDAVVPNSATYAFARALQVPVVPPVVGLAPGLDVTGPLPIAANVDGLTLGMQQYDVVDSPSGIVPASHVRLPFSRLSETAWYHFVQTGWAGSGEILDPYEVLEIPHAD